MAETAVEYLGVSKFKGQLIERIERIEKIERIERIEYYHQLCMPAIALNELADVRFPANIILVSTVPFQIERSTIQALVVVVVVLKSENAEYNHAGNYMLKSE